MDFLSFIVQIAANPMLLVSVLLTLGVIFVNGWTDAPNAIATCVATRSMSPRAAVLMSAVFNFVGVFVMTLVNSRVVATISNMVRFESDASAGGQSEASVALCAAMVSIIVWAVAAWYFGIPTSESHALIAGLSGSAIALHNGLGGINGGEWLKVIYGLILSAVLGFALGFIITKAVAFLFRYADRRKTQGFFRGAQIFGGAAMSFMHGAQDGQKFIGVLLLTVALANGQSEVSMSIPIWLMLLCSLVMGLGTSVGGYKIIKSVGMDMVKLERYQGFSADLAGAGCLLIASVTGLPVSTTQAKTTAIMGVGATKRLSAINYSVVKDMILTWILTFPGCGLIGWLITRLFITIF